MWFVYIALFMALSIVLYLLFWKLYFLREPRRQIPKGKSIVSPASGKVIKVMDYGPGIVDVNKGLAGQIRDASRGLSKNGKMVVIFMSPLDVHVQRAPIGGVVKSVKHTKGSFRSATKLALQNEKNEIIIEGQGIRLKIIQAAGFVARRIECFVRIGERVKKGQRIGRINLGSQVILMLPWKTEILVKEGDRVTEGETEIA